MADPVVLAAKLDLSSAQALHDLLGPLVADNLILDASEVTHFGALGAQVIMAAATHVTAQGKEFKMINTSDRVIDQLAAMGLTPETLAEGTR